MLSEAATNRKMFAARGSTLPAKLPSSKQAKTSKATKPTDAQRKSAGGKGGAGARGAATAGPSAGPSAGDGAVVQVTAGTKLQVGKPRAKSKLSPVYQSKSTGHKKSTAGLTTPPESPSLPPRLLTAKLSQRASSSTNEHPTHRAAALDALGGVKIEVYARIRPPTSSEKGQDIVVVPGPEPTMCHFEGLDKMQNTFRGDLSFEFDQVFGPTSTQAEVYKQVVEPIVEQVALGTSCCLFAYGQTGTGKTHTMRGSLESGDDAGMIQRGVADLLDMLEREQYDDAEVSASYLEIYNERFEDLLEPIENAKYGQQPSRRLTLVEDEKHGNRVDGLTEVVIETAEEVMNLLRRGDKNARVAETAMNKMSNRAHRIFKITARYDMHDCKHSTSMTFVDLAGSEDISKSLVTGAKAAETKHINKSLFALGRVIDALAASHKHIPYRDSKLTQLLADALGGMCQTTFISCISPVMASFRETNNTLRYARRAMQALNISQQPQWKQDKIMLEGLTRKVVQLTAHVQEQAEIHRTKTIDMKMENKKMLAAQKTLYRQLIELPRAVEKLLAEQREAFHARLQDVEEEAEKRIRAMEDAVRSNKDRALKRSQDALELDETFTLDSHQKSEEMQDLATGAIKLAKKHNTVSRKKFESLKQNEEELRESVLRMAGSLETETKSYVAETTNSMQDKFSRTRKLTQTMSTQIDSETTEMQGTLAKQSETRGKKASKFSKKVNSNLSEAGTVVTTTTGKLEEMHEATNALVKSEIKRDKKPVPKCPSYKYPTSFSEPPDPAMVLASMKMEWGHEIAIVEGSRLPGEGTDFTGSLGHPDKSGLIVTTIGPPRSSVTANAIRDAAMESEAEDYETDSELTIDDENFPVDETQVVSPVEETPTVREYPRDSKGNRISQALHEALLVYGPPVGTSKSRKS